MDLVHDQLAAVIDTYSRLGRLVMGSCAMLAFVATTAAAALPLRSGTYVLADIPCKNPPLAALISYDGNAFAYPHAGGCSDEIVSRWRGTYQVAERCRALGDGSKAKPTRTTFGFESLRSDRFSVTKDVNGRNQRLTYPRCGSRSG